MYVSFLPSLQPPTNDPELNLAATGEKQDALDSFPPTRIGWLSDMTFLVCRRRLRILEGMDDLLPRRTSIIFP